MKVKTSELIGKALDWAVETLEIARMRAEGEHIKEWWVAEKQSDPSPYSTDWLWGGEIIERERIDIISDPNGTAGWLGRNWRNGREVRLFGPTPLIAAMRCFVASTLGDEMDVPEELI